MADKLYAAADLIAENGLASTKIEDIAAATGVPKATLYYYFTGKDEILSFLLRDSLAVLAHEVAEAADQPASGRAVSIFGAVMMTAMLHNVIKSDKAGHDIADGVIDLLANGIAIPN